MSPGLERELQLHARALRGLARALVGEGDADDLLQDTAVAALRATPPREHGLGSWLAGIVRHLASRHHRRERRRRRRERLAARSEVVPPPTGVDDRDAFARLCTAVMALPEPYQSTLLLRYLRDLTPMQIATQAGVPVTTVKTRLARGLQLLRERFDAERDDWRAGLAALAGLRRAAAPMSGAAAITGALVMGTGVKLLLGGVAAAAVLAAAWWLATAPPPATVPIAARDGAAVAASQASQPDRLAAEVPPSRSAVDAPAAVAAPALVHAEVRGRAVDEDGAAVAEATVRVRVRANAEPDTLGGGTTATSGVDGTFAVAFAGAAMDRVRIDVQRDGYCPVSRTLPLAAAGSLDIGDIVLATAIFVSGRVVDERGAPQTEVRMEISAASIGRHDTSRADGSFGPCGPFPAGHAMLSVANRSLPAGSFLELALDRRQPRHDVEVTVRSVEPAGIAGVVVDEQGAPLRGAAVGTISGNNNTRTDADGRFELPILAASGEGPFALQGSANGYATLTTDTVFARGTRDVRLRLCREPDLLLRVIAADTKAPVADFTAMLLSPPPYFASRSSCILRREAEGVGRFVGVPRGDGAVWVEPQDPRLAPSTFVPLRVGEGAATEVVVELEPAAVRRLHVQDGEGMPMAGVDVELIDSAGQPLEQGTYACPPMERRWSGAVFAAQLLQRGATDAGGDLELRGPGTRPLALRLRGGGVSLQVKGPIVLGESDALVVTAERAAVWTGRLVPPDVAVALRDRCRGNPKEARLGLHLWRGDHGMEYMLDEPLPIAADGSFRVDGIGSGTWQVTLCIGRGSWHAASITVAAGETLQHDIDVSPVAPLHLELQVFVDGSPLANGGVNLVGWCAEGKTGRRMGFSEMAYTDGEARVAFDTFPGIFRCHVYQAVAGADARILLAPPLRLTAPGRAERTLEIRLASATLQLRRPDGEPAADVELEMAFDDFQYTAEAGLQSDARGCIALARSIAGPHLLRVRPRSLGSKKAQQEFSRQHGWKALSEAWVLLPPLQLAAGAAAEPIVIQLPPAWDR